MIRLVCFLFFSLSLFSCKEGNYINQKKISIKQEVSGSLGKEKNSEVLNVSKNDQHNYNGIYELTGRNNCELTIQITNLKYEFKTNKKNISGNIRIVKNEGASYIYFDNLYGDDPKEIIYAKYEKESLIIQNYGNNMNPYLRLSECEDKYLLLKKI